MACAGFWSAWHDQTGVKFIAGVASLLDSSDAIPESPRMLIRWLGKMDLEASKSFVHVVLG